MATIRFISLSAVFGGIIMLSLIHIFAESGRRDIAAISSVHCAALYGLHILESKVQNNDNNYTRFICISKDLEIYPGANKISLMLSTQHRPGALYSLSRIHI